MKRCTACMIDTFSYEPEMGDEMFTFAPGKCDTCNTRTIVWELAS